MSDPLCKPFSMGRNLFCVHSRKHMDDQPELKAEKQVGGLEGHAGVRQTSDAQLRPWLGAGHGVLRAGRAPASQLLVLPASAAHGVLCICALIQVSQIAGTVLRLQ